MTQWLLDELNRNPKTTLVRFNVNQYLRLYEAGILPEDIRCELIDRYILHKNSADAAAERATLNARHAGAVNSLCRRLTLHLVNSGWSVNCLSPIELNHVHAPEPDLSIIRGTNSDYYPDFPGSSAVLLVVEVADNRAIRQSSFMLEAYAREAIPEYWIVNLGERYIEVHQSPERDHGSYSKRQVLRPNDSLELKIPGLPVLQLSVQAILDATN